MRRSIIALTFVCTVILTVFWSGFYFLNRLFPNSKRQVSRLGFGTTVTLVQDGYGVPMIGASNRQDLMRAQGLLTARDRFFQMELIRRKMSGELSELFGEKALGSDVLHRKLGFKQVADRAWSKMNAETRQVWQSYADGVNSYLKSEVLPWEIQVLGYQPAAWLGRDGLLVVLSMFESLNDFENGEELAYNELSRRFPRAVVDFLTWDFGFFDAPLKQFEGVSLQTRVPLRAQLDIRSQSQLPSRGVAIEKDVYGSNAWVVAGNRTQSKKPLLAGDPHLNLTVPNIWYRTELQDPNLSVRGVTVPGIPGIVIGRNKDLAWSFTNSRADVQDFIELGNDFKLENPEPEFQKMFGLVQRDEVVRVKEGQDVKVKCWDTLAGPILEEELESPGAPGSRRILQWTALDPNPLSRLNPLELNQSHNLEQLWDSLSRWGGPVQNILVATQDNHIAWAMVGQIPDDRFDYGRVSLGPKSSSIWKKYIPWAEMPRVVDPPDGFIANGNQNMWIEGKSKYRWGHDWPSPARGFQIHKKLGENDAVTVEFMQAVQNEIYSPVHVWYRDRLLEAIKASEGQQKESLPDIEDILNLVGSWDGRVTVDSAAYTFLREFRLKVLDQSMAPFVARTSPHRHQQVMNLIAKDSVVKILLTEKPFHLLNPQYVSWDDLLVTAARDVAHHLTQDSKSLSTLKWGSRNILQAKHPFSSRLPNFLGKLLNLPEKPLAGDGLVIRVAKPKNGSSMRMVIDLDQASRSVFSQPGGQSGYFLSPHYQDLFESWYLGKGINFEASQIDFKQVISPGNEG